ncbi:helix-turn-helix domain-containing protein [Alteribacter natronophilus]|uniref:helix-turn-helix domain-containing protein n=1 Tax=Alteribacter natronophilus TaxID=2583810 RepID=UPI00148733DF|nr:helix-turn-helix domain-containing protein [Alteribacter natronophilus]
MDYRLGDKIKELRNHLNISQKELSQDICTQALISKIESNQTYPSAPVLFEISQRLGVDLNYFFSITETPGLDYVEEVSHTMERLMREIEYEEVLRIVNLEKENPLFRHTQLKSLLLWREGICQYHLNRDSRKALDLLDQAIDLLPTTYKNLSEREIDILASKAIIFSLDNQLNEANQIYKELLTKLRTPYFKNNRLLVRILFNASKNSYQRGDYKESINRTDHGIRVCIKSELLYLLGELYYQKGKSLYCLDPDHKEKAVSYMEEAIWIFSKTNNNKFLHYVRHEISTIQ